jgi:hypothetical protein
MHQLIVMNMQLFGDLKYDFHHCIMTADYKEWLTAVQKVAQSIVHLEKPDDDIYGFPSISLSYH